MSNDGRIGGQWQGATIPSATPVVVAMLGAPIPCTVILKSADATRNLELSVDGGTEYFVPNYDSISATQLAIGIMSPISHVRFTGVANDSWGVR